MWSVQPTSRLCDSGSAGAGVGVGSAVWTGIGSIVVAGAGVATGVGSGVAVVGACANRTVDSVVALAVSIGVEVLVVTTDGSVTGTLTAGSSTSADSVPYVVSTWMVTT